MVRSALHPGQITAIHYQRHWALRLLGDCAWLLTPDGQARRDTHFRVDLGRFQPESFSHLAVLLTEIGFLDLDLIYLNFATDGGSETVRVDTGDISRSVVSINGAGPPELLRLLEQLSATVSSIEWPNDGGGHPH